MAGTVDTRKAVQKKHLGTDGSVKSIEEIGETTTVLETGAVDSPVENIEWDTREMAGTSETHLEDDLGIGQEVIIRSFVFKADPTVFRQHKPTRQELFNAHSMLIETMLWADGLIVLPEVEPKVTINKQKTKYRIFVGAIPRSGQWINEKAQTLSQIVTPKKHD